MKDFHGYSLWLQAYSPFCTDLNFPNWAAYDKSAARAARFRVRRPALTRPSADIVAGVAGDPIGHRTINLGRPVPASALGARVCAYDRPGIKGS